MTNLVKIIAFDLETTGLDVGKEEIIEIGAILFSVKESRGRLVPDKLDEFQSFAKPSKPIPASATDTNNITNEMVANAPSCACVLQKFKTFCDNSNCLVGHNAESFDKRFLNVAYGKYSIAAPTQPILDTIKIARNTNTVKFPDYKLGTLAKTFEARREINFKIEEGAMHRAIYDCEMVMHILVAFLRDRLASEEWNAQEFLQALKKKDIQQDASPVKPVRPKATGFI
ncbi:MAG: exonuclease domain-containing protein [Fibromonadales bacterium]|nr:exonuclease domain-containing protein [Fibromonadales bacterium]